MSGVTGIKHVYVNNYKGKVCEDNPFKARVRWALRMYSFGTYATADAATAAIERFLAFVSKFNKRKLSKEDIAAAVAFAKKIRVEAVGHNPVGDLGRYGVSKVKNPRPGEKSIFKCSWPAGAKLVNGKIAKTRSRKKYVSLELAEAAFDAIVNLNPTTMKRNVEE